MKPFGTVCYWLTIICACLAGYACYGIYKVTRPSAFLGSIAGQKHVVSLLSTSIMTWLLIAAGFFVIGTGCKLIGGHMIKKRKLIVKTKGEN